VNGQDYALSVYSALTQPFESTFTDPRGFTYVTGEQVISRLNETLGVFGWSYEVVTFAYNDENDEIVAQGRMRVRDPQTGEWIMREQFGSQKVNRRKDGRPVEIGFDHKGAATDALKKTATLFGVALYLSAKESHVRTQREGDGSQDAAPARLPAPASPPVRSAAPSGASKPFTCQECGAELKTIEFKNADGTTRTWEPFQLANQGQAKFRRVLCMAHYKQANDAAKAASAQSA